MSGIVGFVSNQESPGVNLATVQEMRSFLHYDVSFVTDKLVAQGPIYGTRTHNNIIQQDAQPYQEAGLSIWFEGEFYNQDELFQKQNGESLTDPQLLLKLFQQDRDFSFLERIDGIYAAVIYDAVQNKVHLITDRYGFRYLYWMRYQDGIAWASQVKAFLAMPNFTPTINQVAAQQFLQIGNMLENNTWFDGVELVPSGTVLTWNIDTRSIQQKQYWWWDNIHPLTERMTDNDINDIAEKFYHLHKDAIARRSKGNKKIGLALSGGLDSRSILAAIPEQTSPLHAVTIGMPNCDDIRFAAQAAQIKGAKHHIVELNQDNWLDSRIDQVWLTDGQQNIVHMHGTIAKDKMGQCFSINLGGLGGASILGGEWLKDESYFGTVTEATKTRFAKKMGCSPDLIQSYDQYVGLRRFDYYLLQNTVRRMSYAGAPGSRVYMEERVPFLDNRLMEFIYGLPERYRYEHYIYRRMLLNHFPEYFKSIPWQQIGVPITSGKRRVPTLRNPFRIRGRMRRQLQRRLGVKFEPRKHFSDYDSWIRQEPARSRFREISCNSQARYQAYISAEKVQSTLEAHLNGQHFSNVLGRYLTFEIWLQQVFNGTYRSSRVW
ncbi:MAG: asparagine synthase-related protein [Chloroflexota bacterium]